MQLLRPLGEPPSDGGPCDHIARKIVVAEPFETCEGVSDVSLGHAAVELLRPGGALGLPESCRERPEIRVVPSFRAVQDREDFARRKVFGGEGWDAVDPLEREQGRGVDGEVDLNGLIVERCQESGEGDVVSDELNGPSLGGERSGERCGEGAYVAGRVPGFRCDERVEIAGRSVHDTECDKRRASGERESI